MPPFPVVALPAEGVGIGDSSGSGHRDRSIPPPLVIQGQSKLSRLMGTSVEQIDRTYGHLLPDSLDRARTALDSFGASDKREEVADGR